MKHIEDELRDARKEVKFLSQQRQELKEELEANNKLLELQDEMISALSDGNSRETA